MDICRLQPYIGAAEQICGGISTVTNFFIDSCRQNNNNNNDSKKISVATAVAILQLLLFELIQNFSLI